MEKVGPFHIGDKRTFSRAISGSPGKVHLLHVKPDGTTTAYSTTEASSVYTCDDVPAFVDFGTHTIIWNIYAESADTVTIETDSIEFEVERSASATPFLQPS